jgi:glyoxylase-like metal-dependent hydrolase (beta-lactamase superfamily II)
MIEQNRHENAETPATEMTKTPEMPEMVEVASFFDDITNTITYIIWQRDTRMAAIIDPVLDYDHASGKFNVDSAKQLLAFIAEHDLTLQWILETHAHADHLSSAPYLKLQTGAPIAIGEHIRDVQNIFRPVFNADDVSGDGREFDRLLKAGERLALGDTYIEVLHTPGHTPACVSYYVDNKVFVGDTLFMPDYGTARADFPGGSAEDLFKSIRKLMTLPPHTRVYLCHDYKAPGRDEYQWISTIGAQRADNIHVHDGVSLEDFVAMRRARDATLPAPRLLLPSIQVNIRAGNFPKADDSGVRYLKIPIRGDEF